MRVRAALDNPDLEARLRQVLKSDRLHGERRSARRTPRAARRARRGPLQSVQRRDRRGAAGARDLARALAAGVRVGSRTSRRRYADHDLTQYTDTTITALPTLLADLREVRKKKYAFSYGMIDSTTASVAVPLRDSEGRVVASMNVVGPVERVRQRRDSRPHSAGDERDRGRSPSRCRPSSPEGIPNEQQTGSRRQKRSGRIRRRHRLGLAQPPGKAQRDEPRARLRDARSARSARDRRSRRACSCSPAPASRFRRAWISRNISAPPTVCRRSNACASTASTRCGSGGCSRRIRSRRSRWSTAGVSAARSRR